MEAAENIVENETEAMQELTKVHTPEMHTIEQVCEFLHVDAKKSMKAVVYQRNSDDKYILIFVRRDLEINETKLTPWLRCPSGSDHRGEWYSGRIYRTGEPECRLHRFI